MTLAVLALIGSLISLLQPPDHGGAGADTYGTRAYGYREAFDTLAELKLDVRRALGPPSEAVDETTTLVLWAPENDLINVEPVYLKRLRDWVQHGGRLIVAPQPPENTGGKSSARHRGGKATTVFAELGLPEITTESLDLSTAGDWNRASSRFRADVFSDDEDDRSLGDDIDRYLFPRLFSTKTVTIQAEGEMAALAAGVSQLEVPSELQVLVCHDLRPDGRIDVVDAQSGSSGAKKTDSERHPMLAARFKRGAGEVIVVSDPAILDNRLFPQYDNAILAVNLMARPEHPIVWDEFYHGLTVRGNPLFLLTLAKYALIAAILAALIAVWLWREAVFLGPPLADAKVSRRSAAEYVEAMALLFRRASGSVPFALAELRRGVLWSLHRKFASRTVPETPEEVAAVVARRDPAKARKLLDAIKQADLMLSRNARMRESEVLLAAKELVDCL